MKTRAAHDTQQLSLFVAPTIAERFRIDEDTRRRGLRHVAELRARLEARYPTSRPATLEARRAAVGSRASGRAA